MSIARPNGLGNYDRITIPCGKCMVCLSNKRKEWSFRLQQELKDSKNAYFVTLTYSDEFLPKNKSVSKREIQLFVKRFRSFNGDGFRYFIVAEYGSETNRPHYHGIFFNCDSSKDITKMLCDSWKFGHIHIGTVNANSINYTAKYCINEMVFKEGLENTFTLMSRKPGIGMKYVDRMKDYHIKNNIFYVRSGDFKSKMPRIYRDKIFTKVQIVENKKKYEFDEKKKEIDLMKKFDERNENIFFHQLENKKQKERSIINKSKKTNL